MSRPLVIWLLCVSDSYFFRDFLLWLDAFLLWYLLMSYFSLSNIHALNASWFNGHAWKHRSNLSPVSLVRYIWFIDSHIFIAALDRMTSYWKVRWSGSVQKRINGNIKRKDFSCSQFSGSTIPKAKDQNSGFGQLRSFS